MSSTMLAESRGSLGDLDLLHVCDDPAEGIGYITKALEAQIKEVAPSNLAHLREFKGDA